MDAKKFTKSPSSRLKTGAGILAAARVVDTTPVKTRLAAFTEAHRTYARAQRQVDEIDDELRDVQARLTHFDLNQDDAVEALALALANDHQPRDKPFSNFGDGTPASIKALPFAEQAQAIHALVAAIQRNTLLVPATREAARRAERAAQQMENALAPLDTLRANLAEARHKRDVIAQTWDTTLSALRRGARSAADEGAPGLYDALFHRPARSAKKAKSDNPPAPTPQAQPGPTAAALA